MTKRIYTYAEPLRPSFAHFDTKVYKVKKYRKHPKIYMAENGRGPKWLTKLVYRMAANLGMLGHFVSEEIDMTQMVDVSYINPDANIEEMSKLVMEYVYNTGYSINDIEIICGIDIHDNLLMSLRREMPYNQTVNLYNVDGYPHVSGVRARVVPCFSGIAIIPKEGK